MTRRGWLLFVALGIIWGVPYLFIKVAVTELDPVVVAFGRTALGAALLLPIALRADALRRLLPHWKAVLLYTGVEIVGPWVLLGHAETRITSSATGLLIATVPIVAAVLLTAIGDDRLNSRRVLGLIIGFCGVAVLVGTDFQDGDWLAVMQVLGVVVGYATGPIIISRRLAHLPPLGVVTASLVIAAVAYAPFAVPVWPAQVSGRAAGSVVVLAVLCTAVAFLVMFALIAEAGPARMSLITYLNPVVAVALGALVLAEPITIGLLLGFPLIILAQCSEPGKVAAASRHRQLDPRRRSRPADALGDRQRRALGRNRLDLYWCAERPRFTVARPNRTFASAPARGIRQHNETRPPSGNLSLTWSTPHPRRQIAREPTPPICPVIAAVAGLLDD